MCGPPATTVGYIDPGLLHYVVMNGYVALYIENNKDGVEIQTNMCLLFMHNKLFCIFRP